MTDHLTPPSYTWGSYVGSILIVGPLFLPQSSEVWVHAPVTIGIFSILGGIGVLRRTRWGVLMFFGTLGARQVLLLLTPGFPTGQWIPLIVYTAWLLVNAIYFGKRWDYLTGSKASTTP
jgi:hypothetical protein